MTLLMFFFPARQGVLYTVSVCIGKRLESKKLRCWIAGVLRVAYAVHRLPTPTPFLFFCAFPAKKQSGFSSPDSHHLRLIPSQTSLHSALLLILTSPFQTSHLKWQIHCKTNRSDETVKININLDGYAIAYSTFAHMHTSHDRVGGSCKPSHVRSTPKKKGQETCSRL